MAATSFRRRLREDDTGDDVRELHRRLHKLGFADIDPDADRFGSSTRDAVNHLARLLGRRRTGVFAPELLQEATKKGIRKKTLRGHVQWDGPIVPVQYRVRLLEVDESGGERELGATPIAPDGGFSVEYPAKGSETPLLVIVLADEEGNEIARSQPKLQKRTEETIGLRANDVRSRVRRFQSALPEGLDPSRLDAKGLSLLSQRTGLDVGDAVRFGVASKIAKESGINQEVLFALLTGSPGKGLGKICRANTPDLVRVVGKEKADGTVELRGRVSVEKEIEKLKQWVTASVLPNGGRTPVTDFLDAIGIDVGTKRHRIVETLMEGHTSSDDLAKALHREGAGRLTDAQASQLQAALLLDCILIHQPVVLRKVWPKVTQNSATPQGILFAVAQQSEEFWKEHIGKPANVPSVFTGRGQQRVSSYAKHIRAQLALLLPTAAAAGVVAERLGAPGKKIATALGKSYEGKNPVDLKTWSGKPREILGGNASKKEQQQLLRVIRLFRMAPRGLEAGAVDLLLQLDVHSVRDIRNLGEDALVEKGKASLGADGARRLFAKAVAREGTVAQTATSLRSQPVLEETVEPDTHQQLRLQVQGTSVASALEARSYCRCEHCASVFSPSAYLVDQLRVLEETAPQAFAALTERRPDILGLVLSCNNTNVAFPQIDAVNEILGDVLISDDSEISILDTESTDSDALRRMPEHPPDEAAGNPLGTPPAAALDLCAAVYPLAMPFSRWELMARLYLDVAELSLTDIQDALAPEQDALAPEADADARARTELGLTTWAHKILTGSSGRALRSLWGAPPGGTWLADLASLPVFMKRAGLSELPTPNGKASRWTSYDSYRQLLDCESLAAYRDRLEADVKSCDIESASVPLVSSTGATRAGAEEALGAAHRLLRFARQLGWQLPTVDRLLRAAEGTDVTPAVVRVAALCHRVGRELEVSASDSLAFIAPIDEDVYHGEEASPWALAERAAGTSVDGPALAAQSGVALDELGLLQQHGWIDAVDFQPETLARARSIRHLCDGLGLAAADMVALWRSNSAGDTGGLFGDLELFAADSIEKQLADTVELIRRARLLDDLALKPGDLLYWLADTEHPTRPSEKSLKAFLAEVRPVFSAASEGLPVGAPAEETQRVQEAGRVATALLAEFSGVPGDLIEALLPTLQSDWGGPAEVSLYAALAGNDETVAHSALRGFTRLIAFLRSLNLTPAVLLAIMQNAQAFDALSAVQIASTSDLADLDSEAGLRLLELVHSVASFGSAEHWPEAIAETASTADLAAAGSAELARALEMEQNQIADIITILELEDGDDFREWSGVFLVTRAAEMLRRLGVSASVALGWLDEDGITKDAAQSIRAAIGATRTGVLWNQQVQVVEDALRVATRDALASVVGHRLQLDADNAALRDGSETLSDHLLINVDASPTIPTSRVRLAMTAVQVFVDRWFQGKYQDAPLSLPAPPPDLKRRWAWARNYRLFEANRRVFFFPENWATPWNRTGRSDLFDTFLSKLEQGDMSDDSIRLALADYLEGLSEIARPEVVAVRTPPDEISSLQVFARTRGKPHKYFHRRWKHCVTWSPWERIELDIEGDHVVPAYDPGGRLFMFWGTFQNKSDPEDAYDSTQEDVRRPTRLYDIRLLCSQLRGGKWTRPIVSTRPVEFLLPEELADAAGMRANDEDLKQACALWPLWHADSEQLRVGGRLLNGAFRRDVCSGVLAPIASKIVSIPLAGPPHGDGTADAQRIVVAGGLRLPYRSAPWVEVLGPSAAGPYGVVPNPITSVLDPPLAVQDDGRAFIVRAVSGATIVERTATVPGGYQDPSGGAGAAETEVTIIVAPTVILQWPPSGEPPGAWIDTSGPIILERLELSPQYNLGDGTPRNIDLERHALELEQRYELDADRLAQELLLCGSGTAQTILVGRVALDGFDFIACYHPFTCFFMEQLDNYGPDGLYRPRNRNARDRGFLHQETQETYFESRYNPMSVRKPYPEDAIDFLSEAPYALYNWELFFHIPMLVGTKLSQQGEYERAHKWFKFLFDPSARSAEGPEEDVWQIKPFRQEGRRESAAEIAALLAAGPQGASNEETRGRYERAVTQVQTWLAQPFDPHAVAGVRPSAYARAAAKAYIENLVSWADYLFSSGGPDELSIAEQRYSEARWLLGERPVELDPPAAPAPSEGPTYAELAGNLGALSNALVLEDAIETAMPDLDVEASAENVEAVDFAPRLAFCVPRNDLFDDLRAHVKLSLERLNAGLTLDGEARDLSLFGAQLDPGAIIRAVQGGLSPLSAVAMPIAAEYKKLRFRVLLQRALEACGEAERAGAAVLAAAEKSDGEELAQQRQVDQINAMKLGVVVLDRQLEEAKQNIESQKFRKATVATRLKHYQKIVRRLPKEKIQQKKMVESQKQQLAGQAVRAVGGVLALIGDFDIGASGWAGSPVAKWRFGGLNIAKSAQLAGDVFGVLATAANNESTQAALEAQWQRRDQDWDLQRDLAEKELAEIEHHLAIADLRVRIAEIQLENEKTRIERERAIYDVIKDKFTSKDLHDWMLKQLMPLHRGLFQRALSLTTAAMRAFEIELGVKPEIEAGPALWDPSRRGLLSSERLRAQLQKLSDKYSGIAASRDPVEQRISLRDVSPQAFLDLRLLGKTKDAGDPRAIVLPEHVFDRKPFYYRRIADSVAVSLPNVVGPYDTVTAVLTNEGGSIRTNNDASSANDYAQARSDVSRVESRTSYVERRYLITSTGNEDRGGHDASGESFGPFEGAGLVDSTWKLEMHQQDHDFDVKKLSDVVLTVRYRGEVWPDRDRMSGFAREARIKALKNDGLQRLIIMPQDQYEAFHRWKSGADELGMRFELSDDLVPVGLTKAGLTPSVSGVTIYVVAETGNISNNAAVTITELDGTAIAGALNKPLQKYDGRSDIRATDPISLPDFGEFRASISGLQSARVAEISLLTHLKLG